jgi:hypothetical protein
MQRLLSLLIVVFFAGFLAKPVLAAGLEVTNITVATQAEDGVKARDMAINQAQRMAFGAIVGKSDADIARVNDTSIARLVKGFSVQGEKSASHSYRANFTIRFLQAATNNFVMGNGFQLTPEAAEGQSIAFNNVAAVAVAANTVAPQNPQVAPAQPAATAAPVVPKNVVVLPILDIGSRRVVWDDPNPWRDVWQESDHAMQGMTVTLPLGDVDDVTDIADASFLNGGHANIMHMLQRYNASILYIVIAKNMGAAMDTEGGMSLSLYKHDGDQLKFIRKMIIHPRPGYLFNDAVPAALQMIAMANSNGSTTINSDVLESQPGSDEPPVQQQQPAAIPAASASSPVASQAISGGVITVIVPYQSLQQWVSIQRRLRTVPGIQSVTPIRVSSSSAQVRIVTSTSNTDDLSRNLSIQKFTLQRMANGEMTLVEQ